MAATIRDVAYEAKVSIATVSRYINKTGKLRAATAMRVQTAIENLGFRPNAVGRNLSTSHTKSIGVIIPSLSNPVFADAVSGINAEARACGYTLMLTATDYSAEEELSLVSALLEYRVDGIVLTVSDPEHSPALDSLEKSNVPYVLLYNQPTAKKRPTVTVDNVHAGLEAARLLICSGHQRLGMISGKFNSSDRAQARQRGFFEGAKIGNISKPKVWEVDLVELKMDKLLTQIYTDQNSAPTALFCSNDLLAISVIGALERIGLNVPKDVSVIGFDGIAIGTHLHPTLATILQPSHEMGKLAIRQVLDHLNGGKPPTTIILPHSLRLGESAGPAGKPNPAVLHDPIQSLQRKPAL